VRNERGVEQAMATLRTRLGDAVAEATVEEGAALPFASAVALARTAISSRS
jgi:hypothetical protein